MFTVGIGDVLFLTPISRLPVCPGPRGSIYSLASRQDLTDAIRDLWFQGSFSDFTPTQVEFFCFCTLILCPVPEGEKR